MAIAALTTECRSRPRYKLDLELQFSYQRGARTYHGTGRTKDFSDKGICFESDQELPGGVHLELCINWPISIQDSRPLEMIVHGAVVRTQRSFVVLRLDQFEFRMRGETSFHARANQGAVCNFLA
jgi:PilZ domain